MSLHEAQTVNHRLERWVYADAATRTAASGFVAGDLGKLAYQTDTGAYYRLTATTPTWASIVAGGSYLTAATASDTMAQTSTTLGLNPADVAFAIFGMTWKALDCTLPSSATTFSSGSGSGSGASSIDSNGVQESSGATASSWIYRSSGGGLAGLNPSTSALANGLNFDKRCGFKITFRHNAGTTNGVSRFTIVNSSNKATDGSGNTGKLAGKGIGIEVRNAALWAAVHDGTTYSATNLSTTLTVNAYTSVCCFRSGSGTFDFYMNGAFVATVTGGPTGTAASHVITPYIAADNGGDAANQSILLTECAVFQAIG